VDDFTIAALYEAGKAKVDPTTALSTMNRVLPVYEQEIKSELKSIYEQNLPKNQRNKAVAAASEKVLQTLIRDERLKQVAAGLLRAKVSPRDRTTYIYNRMVSQAAGVKGMDKATAEDLVQSILYPGVDAPNRDTPMLKGVSLPVLVGQKPGKFLESQGDTVSNLAKSMGARTKGVAKNWLRLTRAKSDLLDSGPDLAEVQEFVSAGDAALVLNDPVYLGEIIQRANLSSSPAQKAMMDLLIDAAADVDYWDSSGSPLFKPGKGEANKDTLTLSESAFVKWLKKNASPGTSIQSARRYGQLWGKVSPKLIAAAKELALEKTPRSKRVGPGSNISDPGIRSLYHEDVRGRRAALERRALIRLASSLPVGSEERRAILAGCEKLPEGPMRDNCEKKKEEGASDKKARENPRKKIERHMFVIHKAGDRYVITMGDPRKPGVKIRMRSPHKSDVTEYLEDIGVSKDGIFDMTREFGIPDTYSDFYMRMKRLASQRDLSNTSNALVRLAASLPKGSDGRKVILRTARDMKITQRDINKAKTLSGVDPVLAEYIVVSGHDDGDLRDDVIPMGKATESAGKLKPSQTTMQLPKTLGMALKMILGKSPFASGPGGDLGAIISADNHILDGHHRWSASIAAAGPGVSVGGYKAKLKGADLLKVLNIVTKGMFKRNRGNPGSGDIKAYTPANTKKALREMVEKGAYDLSTDEVREALTRLGGSVEEGIAKMSENIGAVSKAVPSWAPDRSDMPVINEKDLPATAQALNKGLVNWTSPHEKMAGEAIGNKAKTAKKFEKKKAAERARHLIFSSKDKAKDFVKSLDKNEVRGKFSVRKTKGWKTYSVVFTPVSYADTVAIMKHYKPEKKHYEDIAHIVASKTAGKGDVPDALKKHQFTSEDNPNPKGNDKDGDGKTNEPKPDFLKSKKAAYKPERGEVEDLRDALVAALGKKGVKAKGSVSSNAIMIGNDKYAIHGQFVEGPGLPAKGLRIQRPSRDAWLAEAVSAIVPHHSSKKAALVRLAAALPVGSDERKTILRMAAGDLKQA
jgi:hypothetical protein